MEKEIKQKTILSSIEVPFVEDAVQEGLLDEVVHSKLDAQGRAYATGRRKTSSARMWISSGDSVTVNGKKINDYFPVEFLRFHALEAMRVTGINKLNINCTVKGGGLSGQAGAIRHALARAILNYDPMVKHKLKEFSLLTRDSRKKERMTPGLRSARVPQQFSKR